MDTRKEFYNSPVTKTNLVGFNLDAEHRKDDEVKR